MIYVPVINSNYWNLYNMLFYTFLSSSISMSAENKKNYDHARSKKNDGSFGHRRERAVLPQNAPR